MKPIAHLLKEKVWITPAIYSVAAVLFSLLSFYLELRVISRLSNLIPAIFLTSVEDAQTILGILTAAMLTMTTFTFSTILVVLTMYSSQFSPRAPENFIRSRTTRHVLGIFLAGFIYNMLSLLYLQEDVFNHEVLTTSIGIFIVFFCIAAFAYYVHFVASNVQVSTLINKLISDAETVISFYEELNDENFVALEEWNPKGDRKTLVADKAGYIQFYDLVGLQQFAEKEQLEIELVTKIGEYLYEGKPMIHIYNHKERELDLKKYYVIGDDRTAEQDLGYAIQKIIEVAIRAISPGRLDPNTCRNILVRLGPLLGRIGHLKTDELVLEDKQGNKRVLYRFSAYQDILYRTFYQISYHGKNDISVISSMTDSLLIAASLAPKMRHETIWEIQQYLMEGINEQELKSMDRHFLQQKLDELAKLTGQPAIQIGSESKK